MNTMENPERSDLAFSEEEREKRRTERREKLLHDLSIVLAICSMPLEAFARVPPAKPR